MSWFDNYDSGKEGYVDTEFTNHFIDLLSQRATNERIQVKWVALHPHTPPASNPAQGTIVMNLAWHDYCQIPYQLAHEIMHIEHRDEDFSVLYFTTDLKTSFEAEANRDAVRLLVRLYLNDGYTQDQINYIRLADAFSIPHSLLDTVQEAIREIGGK